MATHDALSEVAWRARDADKANAAFAKHGGSHAELEGLIAETKLSAVVAAQRDVAKTGLVSLAVEKFAQFSLLQRYRRLSDANPLSTGDDRLLQLSEAADGVLDTALAAAPQDLVVRLLRQGEAIEAALFESVVDDGVLLQWGPSSLKPVLEPMLAKVCVSPAR